MALLYNKLLSIKCSLIYPRKWR